nr:substrate-binding domain-containing protein [Microbacterium esteraromaticum]
MPSAVSAGVSRLGFFTELAVGCAETALVNGYTLVLTPPDQQNVLDRLDIDGAILLEPVESDQLASELTTRGIPFVTIGAALGPDNVDLHHDETARLLFEHFAERGARAPGILIGSSGRESQRIFHEHYLALAAREGFPPVVAIVDERKGESAGAAATERMLAEHPEIDAIGVPVDAFATGAVRAAQASGRVVGDDLLIATRYDGVRAQTSTPALTAFDLHLSQVSSAAVSLLLQRLGAVPHAEPAAPPLPTLRPRASTAG